MTLAPSDRSIAVTALAWTAIVLGALAMPISVISQVMLVAVSYGTESADLRGWFTVVGAPPAAFVSGIGLLKRKRWAWGCMVGLSATALALNLHDLVHPPRPPGTYVSPGGTVTSVVSTGTELALPTAAVAAAVCLLLLSRRTRAELGIAVGAHEGAVDRAASAPAAPRTDVPPARPKRHATVPARGPALALAALLGVAGGMGWLVQHGIATGSAPFPAQHGANRRSVSRADEPAMFWVAMGLYAAIGAGTFGLATWGAWGTLRERRRGRG